ncbi:MULTISPECIES: benenodin family lasso peptide [Sphingomonadaceae]|nr:MULTISPECIES: benenodin family lasso peptide [unclassified Sphingobium]MBZ9648194.1 benenodin family lasso peptide [Sphingobium sp. 3R8]
MEKTVERRNDDMIDLGAISVETKGPGLGQGDEIGLQNPVGLSDD